ncbi:hypothetical protein BO94DRAFT_480115 [Aspergillus sclerotioniger CBS 115572]|uniref:Uncharacterized protein n=1 Tax=Aspergillus sclerotioniger CBS 115572 TaxID=1450535 RepID=A0A317UXW4_9EURO|nr:hypothetical protein BO94DRAFT_480115 [Aspergillus sclerotioniger CBS 115572]PWY65357.1 hypothetical protein BO94DRAFT_480115 [Aspergillus sclerotioniger CBS 115572]
MSASRPCFSDFPNFKQLPDLPISVEFYRLASQQRWKKGSKTWCKVWNRCINMEYDRVIGKHLTGLDDWRRLCEELDLPGPFPSIRQCKKALSKVYVNIVDVLECRQLHRKPRKFHTLDALIAYTRNSGKFFGRAQAKQDQLLRTLLRKLL